MDQVQIVRLQDCCEVIEAELEQVDCRIIDIALVTCANVLKTLSYDLGARFHDLGVLVLHSIAIELEHGLLVE